MADLRTRFIEDYAGGLLNVARQELSSTGEVLAQDGFSAEGTLFVEDGRGVKSGIRLGASLAECVDPTTETGVLNVRSADRTYSKIKDLKLFATAVASAQAALSQSVSEAFTNFENAFDTLESETQANLVQVGRRVEEIDTDNKLLIKEVREKTEQLEDRVDALENAKQEEAQVSRILEVENVTSLLDDDSSFNMDLNFSQFYGIVSIETDIPAWVTVYTDRVSRTRDSRLVPGTGPGVVADAVTSAGNFLVSYLPVAVGYSAESNLLRLRVINQSGAVGSVNVKLRYISL